MYSVTQMRTFICLIWIVKSYTVIDIWWHFACDNASQLAWRLIGLKKMGKGFVLFKINSSPTAFYIIKPTCISRLVTKVSNCKKNCRKGANMKICLHSGFHAEWWRHLLKHLSLFVLGVALKLGKMSVLAFNILEGEQGNVSLSLPAVRNSVY